LSYRGGLSSSQGRLAAVDGRRTLLASVAIQRRSVTMPSLYARIRSSRSSIWLAMARPSWVPAMVRGWA